MKPAKTLPSTHALAWAVDMKKDTRLNLLLQIVGAGWFFVFGGLLGLVVRALRPEYVLPAASYNILTTLALVLLVLAIVLTLHELVHGAFFLLFTGERPKFGIGPGYVYAAAPDWYFPKGQYLIIGLGPLVVLTVFGLLLIVVAPAAWVGLIFLAAVFNGGGAVGDIYICARIGFEAENVLIRDTGDGFEVFRQQVEG